MTIASLVFGSVLVMLVLWVALFGRKLPKTFRTRVCQGNGWRQAFSQASKEEVRKFLSIFTESFAFNDKEKLKFNPNDQLLSIYRSLYPYKWQADALELETLGIRLQSKYGLEFEKVWRDNLTLGELFVFAQQARK